MSVKSFSYCCCLVCNRVFLLVVDPSEADAVRAHLKAEGETFYELGKVVPGHKETIMKGGVFGA